MPRVADPLQKLHLIPLLHRKVRVWLSGGKGCRGSLGADPSGSTEHAQMVAQRGVRKSPGEVASPRIPLQSQVGVGHS